MGRERTQYQAKMPFARPQTLPWQEFNIEDYKSMQWWPREHRIISKKMSWAIRCHPMSSDKKPNSNSFSTARLWDPSKISSRIWQTWKKRRRRTTDMGHTTIFIEYYRRSMKIISLWYYIILHHSTITVLHLARPCYACYTSGSLRCAPCHGKEISWQLQRDAGRVQTAGAPGSTSIGHDSGRANGQIGL